MHMTSRMVSNTEEKWPNLHTSSEFTLCYTMKAATPDLCNSPSTIHWPGIILWYWTLLSWKRPRPQDKRSIGSSTLTWFAGTLSLWQSHKIRSQCRDEAFRPVLSTVYVHPPTCGEEVRGWVIWWHPCRQVRVALAPLNCNVHSCM